MPDGPWTKYQQPTQQADGPWNKYGDSKSTTPPQPDKPGAIQRFGEATGIPTSLDQVRSLNEPSGMPFADSMPGMNIVSNIIKGMVTHAVDANKSGLKETGEAVDNIKAGQPVMPNIGKMYYGAVHGVGAVVPPLEPAVNFGEDAARKNYAGMIGGGLGMFTSALAAHGASKIPALAAAEHNPNVVYHRYLDSVGHVPEEMPSNTPRVNKALIGKVDVNNPAVAERMRVGTTTLSDLDKARIVSNKASQSAYSSTGKPTEMVEGYQNAADSLRDTIYPKLEALHNLEPGTLGGIKRLEGRLIRMGPEPELNTANPNKGGVVSYAIQKGITRPITKAVTGMQTRMADVNLPEPQSIDLRRNFPPPSGKMVKSIQPASVEIGGPQEVSGRPPQTSHTVAAPEHEPIRPALYEPPPNNEVHPVQIPPEGGARIPKVAPQAKPLPALPKDMLNLPPNILDEIEEMHRKGQLIPPRNK